MLKTYHKKGRVVNSEWLVQQKKRNTFEKYSAHDIRY